MSYLARLKERLHRGVLGDHPTEPTDHPFVGCVGELSAANLQIETDLGRLDQLQRYAPAAASHDQWEMRIMAAKAFAQTWSTVARQLGWSSADLYSLHPRAPLQRLDAMGAAYCTWAGRVTAVTAETIALEIGPGRLLAIRRPTFSALPAWETFCATGVPA